MSKRAGRPKPHRPNRPAAAPLAPAPRAEWGGWKWIVLLILAAGAGYGVTLLVPKVRAWFAGPAAPPPAPEPEPPLGPQPRPDGPAPPGMVWIPGGTFRMGTTERHPHFADAPEHEVEVGGFWLDETEVTNAQFAEFVKATGYVTVAEQKPTLESIRARLPPGEPDPPADKLVPGALVFTQPPGPVPNHHSLGARGLRPLPEPAPLPRAGSGPFKLRSGKRRARRLSVPKIGG